jgi:hypothetical protein
MSDDGKLFSCYDPWFLAWALAAALATVVLTIAAKRFAPMSVARLLLALGQGAAVGGVIVAAIVRLRRLDELQRQIQREAISYAFATGLAAIVGWSFLEKAGLPHVDWGVWSWPMMTALWGGALLFVMRRYR